MGTDPGSADLAVDPDTVEATRTALKKALESLDDYPFDALGTIQANSFGDNGYAALLSYHHRRAHQVMSETLAGVRTEITQYLDALNTAVDTMFTVDSDSATNIRKQQELVESLGYLEQNSAGNQAHEQARNDQDTSGAPEVGR